MYVLPVVCADGDISAHQKKNTAGAGLHNIIIYVVNLLIHISHKMQKVVRINMQRYENKNKNTNSTHQPKRDANPQSHDQDICHSHPTICRTKGAPAEKRDSVEAELR